MTDDLRPIRLLMALVSTAAFAGACLDADLDNRACAEDADCIETYHCVQEKCVKATADGGAGDPRVWACGNYAHTDDGYCDCGCGDDDPECPDSYSKADCDNDWCYVLHGGNPVTASARPTDPALCDE